MNRRPMPHTMRKPTVKRNPLKYKVWVINLDSSTERLKRTDRQLKRFRIPYQRFSAINGLKLDVDQLVKDGLMSPEIAEASRQKRGSLGCYLSHVKLWEQLLKDDCDAYLIFEDDVIIYPTTRQGTISALRAVPSDWDLLYLGSNKLHGKRVGPFVKPYVGNFKGYNSGMFGYLVNKKSVEKLLKVMLPIRYHTKDPWVRSNFHIINAYFLINKVVGANRTCRSDRTSIK